MPAKRKKAPTSRKKKVPSKAIKVPAAIQPAAPPLSGLFGDADMSRWTLVLLGVTALLWLGSKFGIFAGAERIFLLAGLVLAISFYLKLNNLKYNLLLIVLGWVLVALAIGTNANYEYVFSFWPHFNIPNPLWTLGIGVGLLLGYWRFLPSVDPSKDIPKNWARFWFWVIFAIAAFLRLNKVHEAVGCYWDDLAVAIADPRGIMEFHEHPLLMPIANREPLYPYFFAGLWALMPDAYANFVQRLGGGLMDLAGVWLLYLLGKEVAGRRVGLIAAALAAVSKPLLIAAITGASNITAPMAVALLLLMTFRLFKKPDWKHFLYWGLSLGFLPYSYTSVRPWLLFIVTVVFFWIWFYKEKQGKVASDAPLGWGSLAAWSFAFLVIHHFLPKDNPLVAFLTNGWVSLVVLVFLIALFFQALRSTRAVGHEALVPRFFLGLLLAVIVLYPLASSPLIGVHAAGFSIFHNHTDLKVHVGLDSLKIFIEKIGDTLHTMFISGEDRGDMNLNLDSFFDYHFIPILALGLVSVLTRPNWTKILLLAGGLVGISPHILSIDGHSGRLVCGLVPLAVLAGMGVEQLYQAARTAFPGGGAVFLLTPLMALYLGWASWGSYEKVWKVFFTGDRVEKTVSDQIKLFSKGARVFTAPYALFVSSQTQALLDQGYDVYSLLASNPIPLPVGEKPKDVVVLFHIYDKNTEARIQKEFKNVTWDMVYLGGWPDKRIACRRAIIPGNELTYKVGRMVYLVPVPVTNWTRDYLMNRNILGYGVIEVEESVADPYSPIPSAMGGRMVNLRAHFDLPKAAHLKFKVTTNDYVKFEVDGKKLLYLSPDWAPQTAEKTVEIEAGSHKIEYDIWLQHEQSIPRVTVSVDGASSVELTDLTQGQPANP